jgi:hypothetical protein
MLQADSANSVPHANEPRIWKIRTIKNYPEAHNHILVGKFERLDRKSVV